MSGTKKRVLIVGGVAGGASCAARLRRLDESAEIVMFDRGPHVSFANCGLPYFVGDVIADEKKLLVASAETFHERFRIVVHTETEATEIYTPGNCGPAQLNHRTPSAPVKAVRIFFIA